MLRKIAYQCEHCKKLYLEKNTCYYHEKTCDKCEYTFSCNDCLNAITELRGKRYFNKKKVAIGCSLGHKIGAKQFVECKDKKIFGE